MPHDTILSKVNFNILMTTTVTSEGLAIPVCLVLLQQGYGPILEDIVIPTLTRSNMCGLYPHIKKCFKVTTRQFSLQARNVDKAVSVL